MTAGRHPWAECASQFFEWVAKKIHYSTKKNNSYNKNQGRKAKGKLPTDVANCHSKQQHLNHPKYHRKNKIHTKKVWISPYFFYFLVSTKKICKGISCFSRNVQIFTFKSILNVGYISAKAINNIFDCRSISVCVNCINNCHNST